MTAKVIALLQGKGGSSKTTTAINLMMAIRERNIDCILCDMDEPKPDAIFWADNGEEMNDYVFPLFESNPKPVIDRLKEKHEYIVIDTPPQFEAAALKAALLADIAIIPCSPSSLDMQSLEKAAECAVMANIPYKFLASRIVKNTNITNSLINALKDTGHSFDTIITNSVAISESSSLGKWVGSYKPNTSSHKQYQALVNEVIKIME